MFETFGLVGEKHGEYMYMGGGCQKPGSQWAHHLFILSKEILLSVTIHC